jgi:hypothetical protein
LITSWYTERHRQYGFLDHPRYAGFEPKLVSGLYWKPPERRRGKPRSRASVAP